MSQKFLKKEQAVINLKGSAPRINFLKEKLTALLLIVFLVFVVYKCSNNAGENKVITSTSQEPKKQVLPTDVGNKKVNVPRIYKKNVPGIAVDTAKVIKTPVDVKKTNNDTYRPGTELPIENNEVKAIRINLKTSGNIVSWNPALNEAAREIRISFIDSKGRYWVSNANVTGKSSYTYNPRDGRAGNISTKVVLSIIKNDGYKIEGKMMLDNEYFECSSAE
jgi:hypothetical protein